MNKDTKSLNFSLPYPMNIDGVDVIDLSLSPANGAVEKIIVGKKPDNPYTWICEVISVCLKEINGTPISAPCRAEYAKTGELTIPSKVRQIPLSVASIIIVEIHMRLWKDRVENQSGGCMNCGKLFTFDFDLSKIEMSKDNVDMLEKMTQFRTLECELPNGFEYSSPTLPNQVKAYPEFDGKIYNKFIFRVPTIGDAMNNEKENGDQVMYWRRIAFDCLLSVENDKGEVLATNCWREMGLRLYNSEMSSKDLIAIRKTLRESMPTLWFFHDETCPHCNRNTKVALEGNAVFSD